MRQPSVGDEAPLCVATDPEHTIFFADMSGDGLAGLVRIRNGDVCYWPNCGYGQFGTMVCMSNAPRSDSYGAFDGTRVRLADMDGSGTTDILYLSPDSTHMFLNQSGNSLHPRQG